VTTAEVSLIAAERRQAEEGHKKTNDCFVCSCSHELGLKLLSPSIISTNMAFITEILSWSANAASVAGALFAWLALGYRFDLWGILKNP